MADESVHSQAAESLEDLSGEWMRRQLQEAAVNTGTPPHEPAKEAPSSQPPQAAVPSPPPAPPSAPDDVLTGLAQSVSQAVVSAVSQLEHRRTQEKTQLEETVREQEQLLKKTAERVEAMNSRFDQLTDMIQAQQTHMQNVSDTYERLSGDIAEIQNRDSGREKILEELRRETLDLSVSFSDRQDQIGGRIDLQQADIENLKVEIANLKPFVEQTNERLNRHSQAIRAVFEAEKRREDALGQLSEAASNLKSTVLRYPEGLSAELL